LSQSSPQRRIAATATARRCSPRWSGRERHAACVNILPGITSVYAWEGEIETAEEQLMLIKTAAGCYGPLETFIKNHHPYEVPEIIAIPIEQGSSDYLEWIRAWVGRRS
jgi:periplasmic divalent cation tolerance protein